MGATSEKTRGHAMAVWDRDDPGGTAGFDAPQQVGVILSGWLFSGFIQAGRFRTETRTGRRKERRFDPDRTRGGRSKKLLGAKGIAIRGSWPY